MTVIQAREYINTLLPLELKPAKKRNTYICPLCGNGSGNDGDGITSRDNGKHWKCFKCGFSGDYLDFLKCQHNTTSEKRIFFLYGLEIDGQNPTEEPPTLATFEADSNFTSFYKCAETALKESPDALTYLEKRGISPETATRFMIGYCPDWRSPTAVKKGANPLPSRRIIIPTSETGYTTRVIDGNIPAKYRFIKEGRTGYFGLESLYGTTPAFIVEGAIDALSVYEVGGAACALGSTSGIDGFLGLVRRHPPTVPLILSLDNDEAGKNAQNKLNARLQERGIVFYEVNISGEYKDPNEHLTANRDAFSALVNGGISGGEHSEFDAEKAVYLEMSADHYLGAFAGKVGADADTPVIPTGFSRLDMALDGGLYAGLYVIGAVSSLGKTTFVLQAADQIAQQGTDILIFSLEMSRYELIAKSISRLTFEISGKHPTSAKTARGIMAGSRWGGYNDGELEIISCAVEAYRKYGGHIFICEGGDGVTVEHIRRGVQRHIMFTGNPPVVVIDYLQIIAPHDVRATEKQAVDKAVFELKRLSRDYKIPVIAVSSFNRDSYTSPVNMASFKESGAVEYSSDVLMGLQLAGIDNLGYGEGGKSKAIKAVEDKKRADPRKVQLKILKNRNGGIGVGISYDYYTMFNKFCETGAL